MPIPSVRSHFRSSSTGHAGRQQAALRSRGCSQASLQKQSLRLVLLGCFWSVGLLTAMKMPSEASHRLFFNFLDVSGAARSGRYENALRQLLLQRGYLLFAAKIDIGGGQLLPRCLESCRHGIPIIPLAES